MVRRTRFQRNGFVVFLLFQFRFAFVAVHLSLKFNIRKSLIRFAYHFRFEIFCASLNWSEFSHRQIECFFKRNNLIPLNRMTWNSCRCRVKWFLFLFRFPVAFVFVICLLLLTVAFCSFYLCARRFDSVQFDEKVIIVVHVSSINWASPIWTVIESKRQSFLLRLIDETTWAVTASRRVDKKCAHNALHLMISFDFVFVHLSNAKADLKISRTKWQKSW